MVMFMSVNGKTEKEKEKENTHIMKEVAMKANTKTTRRFLNVILTVNLIILARKRCF